MVLFHMAEKKRAGFKIDSEAFRSILFLLQSTCRDRIERKHAKHDPQTPSELQDRAFFAGDSPKIYQMANIPNALQLQISSESSHFEAKSVQKRSGSFSELIGSFGMILGQQVAMDSTARWQNMSI